MGPSTKVFSVAKKQQQQKRCIGCAILEDILTKVVKIMSKPQAEPP